MGRGKVGFFLMKTEQDVAGVLYSLMGSVEGILVIVH